jgi:hypothetical protein
MDATPQDKAYDLLWMAMDEIGNGAFRTEEEKAGLAGLMESLRGAVEKAETQETASTDKGTPEIGEAVKLLQVALGRMKSGEVLDEETHQAVARAREILAGEPKAETPSGDVEGEEANRETQAKAGAKMSADRRGQFKEALDSLVKIFESILPEEERKSWSAATAEKADLVKAKNSVETLKADLEKSQEKLKKANVDLAKAQDRPGSSNVVPVEKGTEKSFSWGSDLNDEDDE